ncbi:MAG: hypothetical protein GY772_12060 [bacterium]|nr:hypothetical protein [bacterium]
MERRLRGPARSGLAGTAQVWRSWAKGPPRGPLFAKLKGHLRRRWALVAWRRWGNRQHGLAIAGSGLASTPSWRDRACAAGRGLASKLRTRQQLRGGGLATRRGPAAAATSVIRCHPTPPPQAGAEGLHHRRV